MSDAERQRSLTRAARRVQRLVSWHDPLASKELRIEGVEPYCSPPRCVVILYESAAGLLMAASPSTNGQRCAAVLCR